MKIDFKNPKFCVKVEYLNAGDIFYHNEDYFMVIEQPNISTTFNTFVINLTGFNEKNIEKYHVGLISDDTIVEVREATLTIE